MGARVYSVQAKIVGEDVVLTTIGQSPRGTKVLLKSAKVPGVRGPREEFRRNVEAAVRRLLPDTYDNG